MAQPTITTITPSSLWTAGQFITITGTNFQMWTIPSNSLNGPYPPPTPTVLVTVDGVSCEKVAVRSGTELTCMAPAHDAGTAAVVVTNIEDDGTPIVGEASAPSTVTYLRPSLTDLVDLERAHLAVLTTLKQQILDNVVQFVAVDYTDGTFEETLVSSVPALLLSGPTVVDSEQVYRDNANTEVTVVGGFASFEAAEYVNLEYGLTVVTNNQSQLVKLQGIVQRFFRKTRKINILKNASDPSQGTVSYILERPTGEPIRATTTPNKQDIRSFEVSFRVLNVAVEGLAGFPNENQIDKGGPADQIDVISVSLT